MDVGILKPRQDQPPASVDPAGGIGRKSRPKCRDPSTPDQHPLGKRVRWIHRPNPGIVDQRLSQYLHLPCLPTCRMAGYAPIRVGLSFHERTIRNQPDLLPIAWCKPFKLKLPQCVSNRPCSGRQLIQTSPCMCAGSEASEFCCSTAMGVAMPLTLTRYRRRSPR